MVYIAPPPPIAPVTPLFATVSTERNLVRMYDPKAFDARTAKFRFKGPYRRFDHQQEINDEPAESVDRGILYAGDSLSGCLVEIFGDTKMVEVGSWEVAVIKPTRNLTLLDLRGAGAMKSGTVAAVCKDSNHQVSQQWSRHFYEHSYVYGAIDGLLFENAHNEEKAYALYERCQSDLSVVRSNTLRTPAIFKKILLIAAELGMVVDPNEATN
jgi:RES domain